MEYVLRMKETIPAPIDIVFKYWTEPELLEKWASPHGMTLKIPKFDARTGGKYRYEHTGKDGKYICTGCFKEFIPEHKLVHEDHVIAPEGNVLFDRLESTVTFMEDTGGTVIHVIQSGFETQAEMDECEQGWNESFSNLIELIGSQRFRPGLQLRMHQIRGE